MGPIADSGTRNRADLHSILLVEMSSWRTSRAATAPITRTAGDSIGVVASSSRRQRAVTSSAVVADVTAATGVDGSRPPAISSAAIEPRWATPISTTIVPPTPARARQSTSPSPSPVGRRDVATVTGDDRDRGGQSTHRDRDAGRGRRGHRRRDAGHHLERHTGVAERHGLLAAAPEDERVAALQPHHRPVAGGELDEQGVDQLLGHAPAGPLADVDQLGVRPRQGEHAVADQGVVHDDVRLGDEPGGAHRQQLGVAGASTDEGDHVSLAARRRTTGSGSHVSIVAAPISLAQAPNVPASPPSRPAPSLSA